MKEIDKQFIIKIATKVNTIEPKVKIFFTFIRKNKVIYYTVLAYFFSAIILMLIFNPSNCYTLDSTGIRIIKKVEFMTLITTIYIYICFFKLIESFLINIFYMNYSKRQKSEILSNGNKHKALNFFHALLIIFIGFFNYHTIEVINNISSTYSDVEEKVLYIDKAMVHNKSDSYYLLLKGFKDIPSQFDIKLLTDSDTYSNIDTNRTIKLTFRKGIWGYVVLDMSKIYNMYYVYK